MPGLYLFFSGDRTACLTLQSSEGTWEMVQLLCVTVTIELPRPNCCFCTESCAYTTGGPCLSPHLSRGSVCCIEDPGKLFMLCFLSLHHRGTAQASLDAVYLPTPGTCGNLSVRAHPHPAYHIGMVQRVSLPKLETVPCRPVPACGWSGGGWIFKIGNFKALVASCLLLLEGK